MDMPVFDGHNDALSRLWNHDDDPVARFQSNDGHVNVPAARAGGLGGGFFAMYSSAQRAPFDFSIFGHGMKALPLSPQMDRAPAADCVMAQAGIAHLLDRAGQITICRDGAGLNAAFQGDTIACVLHLEGAEAIGPDLQSLEALHALGLRSLGPVWSRPTIFGEGVPFAYDRDGDTGGGLTDDGRRLVARCRDLGIVVDTSHLTMQGFWDIGEMGLPLVATHSNAYAVLPVTRNLTDDQLRAIAETRGMAGLNFGTIFLDKTGWDTGQSTIDACLRQLDHMISVAGEDHIGLGSDFDGAPMPAGLSSAADLPNLVAAMRTHGFGEALVEKLCHGNWLSFLTRTLDRT